MSASFSAEPGAQALQRREHLRAQVGQRLGVGAEDQLGQVRLGVLDDPEGAGPQRAVVRRPHLQPRPGRPGDGAAAQDRAQQRGPAAPVRVGHQQQHVVVEVGQVGGQQGPRRHRGQHRPHLRLRAPSRR